MVQLTIRRSVDKKQKIVHKTRKCQNNIKSVVEKIVRRYTMPIQYITSITLHLLN